VYFAESLVVTTPWRRRKTDQVPQCSRGKQTEVIEDPAIARRYGVVRLIHDDYRKIIRTEPR
jgi:hypothetical protein